MRHDRNVDDCRVYNAALTPEQVEALASGESDIAGADLEITKIDDDGDVSIGPGDTLIYTVTVHNHGDDEAENVVVVDTLPAGVTYVSDDSSCRNAAEDAVGPPDGAGAGLGSQCRDMAALCPAPLCRPAS